MRNAPVRRGDVPGWAKIDRFLVERLEDLAPRSRPARWQDPVSLEPIELTFLAGGWYTVDYN